MDDIPRPNYCERKQHDAYRQHDDVVDDYRPEGHFVIPHGNGAVYAVEIVLKQIEQHGVSLLKYD